MAHDMQTKGKIYSCTMTFVFFRKYLFCSLRVTFNYLDFNIRVIYFDVRGASSETCEMADKTMKNIAKNKYVKIRRIRYTFIVVARNF